MEFLGIPTSNIILSSLTHLVMTQFRSGILELSETGIGRNSSYEGVVIGIAVWIAGTDSWNSGIVLEVINGILGIRWN
jgi:hypothetical protein